ncbi:MAG: hypothetical protein JOZ05_08735 [Acetobacteraceae bacterium]|nr:hypothetical protein [Acetobacteraceae bacterium]
MPADPPRPVPPPPGDPAQVYADRQALLALRMELRSLSVKLDAALAAARRMERLAALNREPVVSKIGPVIVRVLDLQANKNDLLEIIEALIDSES